eukprot:810139-Rhodomonas_salina.1
MELRALTKRVVVPGDGKAAGKLDRACESSERRGRAEVGMRSLNLNPPCPATAPLHDPASRTQSPGYTTSAS